MNEEFDNTNRGACWPAKSKRSDNSPDYTGRMDVDGVEYWVNMWIDPGAGGSKPPITFSVKAKDVQLEPVAPGPDPLQDIKDLAAGPDTPQSVRVALDKYPPPGPDTPQPDKPFDDDIPF